MATEVITGNLTSTYFVDSNDIVRISQSASLITTDTTAVQGRTNLDNHITLVIDGLVESRSTLAPTFPLSLSTSAILLLTGPYTGTDLVTGNVVRVGATGHVISKGDLAILAMGSQTTVLNDGLIEGLGGIQVSGRDNFVRNSGTIEFGLQGIGSAGQGSPGTAPNIIQNTGVMTFDASLSDPNRASLAINASGDYTKIFNSGTMNCQNGILMYGDFSYFKNTGVVEATGTAVTVAGTNNYSLLNSGTLHSSGAASIAIQLNGFTNTVLNNSGTISSAGIALQGSATRIVNTGDISAGDRAIFLNCPEDFMLVNSGTISSLTTGIVIYDNGSFRSSIITVSNSGTISGGLDPLNPGDAIRIDGGTARVFNTGLLRGDVQMNGIYNSLTNSGTIQGDVFSGYGALIYSSTGAGIVLGDVTGSLENDRIYGGNSVDRLFGNDGNDQLNGGGGNDVLNGGFARDLLTGGTGADVFIFSTAEDITSYYGSDRIVDFQSGIDHIDLSALMAGGRFIGGALFTGHADEVRYNAATGQLVGDVNGDRVFDWSMALTNKAALTAADFNF